MSITVSSATNDELTVLWQGLDFASRLKQGEWWVNSEVVAGPLLAQIQAQAVTNGIWPIAQIDA